MRSPGYYTASFIPPQGPVTVRVTGGCIVSDEHDLLGRLYAARERGATLDTVLQASPDELRALASAPYGTPYTLHTPGGRFAVYVDLHPGGIGGSIALVDPAG